MEDPALTLLGRQQAQRLARWIPALELTRVISSPFLRALQTAQAIGHATALAPEVRTALHETGGCYRGYTGTAIVGRPGMSRAEIERDFPGFRITPDIDGQGWWPANRTKPTRRLACEPNVCESRRSLSLAKRTSASPWSCTPVSRSCY